MCDNCSDNINKCNLTRVADMLRGTSINVFYVTLKTHSIANISTGNMGFKYWFKFMDLMLRRTL